MKTKTALNLVSHAVAFYCEDGISTDSRGKREMGKALATISALVGDKLETVANFCAARGFDRWDTGGGCTALHREWAKHYALITALDGPEMPDFLNEPCVLGFYLNDQDHSEACVQFNCATVPEAVAIAEKFNGEVGGIISED